ncbi:hypothetical protein FRC19_004970 [Serendipita sp. 401]|nr:hypothetical protein FRC19_004970 [Serendipita sp. 401]KAG9053079.1 hypothetical protein FS842_008731 [Serendipita sp. 407]
MTFSTPQYASYTQEDLVRLIHHYRIILQDPNRPAQDRLEAERELAALYQPTYATSSTGQIEHNNRVLGGYRATLANPNVSDAAKAHARAMLEMAGADVRTQKERSLNEGTNKQGKGADAHLARQLGGYKSALKNPNVSPEAKAHARNMLAQHGIAC